LKEDLARGIEVPEALLSKINSAIAREERAQAVEELKTLVEDWKGHRIEGFGELLLHGQFTVLKGDGMTVKNEEREVGSKTFLVKQIPFLCSFSIISHFPPFPQQSINANNHSSIRYTCSR